MSSDSGEEYSFGDNEEYSFDDRYSEDNEDFSFGDDYSLDDGEYSFDDRYSKKEYGQGQVRPLCPCPVGQVFLDPSCIVNLGPGVPLEREGSFVSGDNYWVYSGIYYDRAPCGDRPVVVITKTLIEGTGNPVEYKMFTVSDQAYDIVVNPQWDYLMW